ncbi:MAG: hypothetical protein LLG01_05600 [Planctomycetaceae bacterium]|nr:hypothetical protein [Planctomycetaceae bacterium]
MDPLQRMMIGVACRRGLLALAAAALAMLVWVGVQACAEVTAQGQRTFVLSDAVAALGAAASTDACIIYPADERSGQAIIVYSSEHPAHFSAAGLTTGVSYGRVDRALCQGTIQGMPYGSYAFEKATAAIAGLSPPERLFLLEAGLTGSDASALKACLGKMSRLGAAAFIRPGPAEDFVASLRTIRKDFAPALVLGVAGAKTPLEALRLALRRVGKIPRANIYFVSRDEALGRQASRLGVHVVLIGPPAAKPLAANVLQFADLPALDSYLDSLGGNR